MNISDYKNLSENALLKKWFDESNFPKDERKEFVYQLSKKTNSIFLVVLFLLPFLGTTSGFLFHSKEALFLGAALSLIADSGLMLINKLYIEKRRNSPLNERLASFCQKVIDFTNSMPGETWPDWIEILHDKALSLRDNSQPQKASN